MKKIGTVRKPLLFSCLGASLALHLALLYILWANPFYFSAKSSSALMNPTKSPLVIPKENETLLVERIERALEESLNDVVTIAQATHEDAESVEPRMAQRIPLPKVEPYEFQQLSYTEKSYASSMPRLFDPEEGLNEFALENEVAPEEFAFESEGVASVELPTLAMVTEANIEDDFTMTADQFSPTALSMNEYKQLEPQFLASLQTLTTATESIAETPTLSCDDREVTNNKMVLPNSVNYLRKQWVKRSLAEKELPDIEHYELSTVATTLDWEEEVDVDITLRPTPDGKRYIFSLNLQPTLANDCTEIPQNYYFLIDKTSSVGRQKFNRYKRAVLRSMAALQSGDTFNIIVFDKKVGKLSDHPLKVTPKTIQYAEEYLERQTGNTHHSSSELYTSLDKLLPTFLNPNEMHYVILITDGNTLLTPRRQKEALSKWAGQFSRNVQFYTASAGKGNNLPLLDLLSHFTGGRLLYSETNAAFPRKLVRLVKDLHSPLLSNIHVEVTAKDSGANLTLYPTSKLLPPLFASTPYRVVGTVDELCDLTLFFQGKNEDRWIHVQKTLSLLEAERGGRSLEKQWAEALSKVCYENFLETGKKSHLEKAQQLVAPYKGVIALEQ